MIFYNAEEKKQQGISKKVVSGVLLGLAVSLLLASPAWADTGDSQEQNRRARQEAEERAARQNQTDVHLQKAERKSEDTSLPDEKPSFTINTIKLDGDEGKAFPWTQKILAKYQGRKMGIKGINLIVRRLTNAFIERGYVTTRVVIPEQNLSAGTLRLILVTGKIHDIRFEEPSFWNNWKTAFPARPGDILNLRDLEQGLEQMKRIPSQDVSMKLVPADKPGESDVVITVKRTKPWKAILSLDDSGTKPTGKMQLSQTLAVDNLFGFNDLFNIAFNNDLEGEGPKLGTKGNSLYYSVPYGNSTFTLYNSQYSYHQTVKSTTQDFISSGESSKLEFKISRMVHRTQKGKTSLEFGIIKKHSQSFLDDTEIEVQRKNTTAAKIGIVQRQYLGQATLDIAVSYRKGVPWFGAQTDPAGQETTRYNMGVADIGLVMPVKFGKAQGQYKITMYGQYTNNTLYQTDMLSIGNRYTVRGFDGEQTLSAEKGWFVENELGLPVGKTGLEVYAGLDYGAVYGPNTENLTGRILVGAVTGLRGGGKCLTYDLFVGWPIRKPSGFNTAKQTFGFQLICQI